MRGRPVQGVQNLEDVTVSACRKRAPHCAALSDEVALWACLGDEVVSTLLNGETFGANNLCFGNSPRVRVLGENWRVEQANFCGALRAPEGCDPEVVEDSSPVLCSVESVYLGSAGRFDLSVGSLQRPEIPRLDGLALNERCHGVDIETNSLGAELENFHAGHART